MDIAPEADRLPFLSPIIGLFARFALPRFRVGEGERSDFADLPGVCDTHAFGDWQVPHLVRRLNDRWLARLNLEQSGPEFDFLKGLLALERGRPALAALLLDGYRKRHTERDSGIVAARIVARLEMLALDEDQLRDMKQDPEKTVSPAPAELPVLCIGDSLLERLTPRLDFLAPARPATIIAQDIRGKTPESSATRRYRVPEVFVWHRAEGYAAHAEVDRLATGLAIRIAEHIPAMADMPDAVRFCILDLSVYKWLMLQALEEELGRAAFAEIHVLTGSEAVYRVVRQIAARAQPGVRVVPRWEGTPPLLASPLRALWPVLSAGARTVWRQTGGSVSRLLRSMTRAATSVLDAFAGSAPAVLGWNARDRNYITGLERLLSAILPRRPVILFLDSDDDEKVAKLHAFAAGIERPTGHYFHIYRYSDFLAAARSDLEELGIEIGRQARHYANTDGLSPLARDICAFDYAMSLSSYPHLRVLALIGATLDAVIAACRPAYGVLGSARGAAFAAIAEKLAAHDIPAMDAHTYLVGRNARQVAPPTRYVGVIDDQQEAFVTEAWGIPHEDVLRIGYIWREQEEAADSDAASTGDGQKRVLICSQPGEPEMVENFMANVLDVIAADPRIVAEIKPHPAEPEATLLAYDAALVARKLEKRVKRLGAAVPVSSLFGAADLVITRTSNVGIEAALRLRPTIRYIEFDRYDPGLISNVPYAANVTDRDTLGRVVDALLFSPEAIAEHRTLQMGYRLENPAQAQTDGAERIARFLEAHVSSPGGARRRTTDESEKP